MAALREHGLTIGDLAQRTGLAVSAIRFYETHGILAPLRNAGGHRRYARSDIRRLSFVIAAQRLGFPLTEIAAHLADLPPHKALSQSDWTRIAQDFGQQIDRRIEDLQRLRRRLDGCIGCGCLSLEHCQLYNPDDKVAVEGTGPRRAISE